MAPSCADPPPAALLAGIAEFNRGEYFACHERLEAIWMHEPGPIRRLYQGLLQIGVGLYHLHNGNYRGTVNLLGSGIAYLEPFAPLCNGVCLDPLLAQARLIRAAVVALGPAHVREYVLPSLPQITLTDEVRLAVPFSVVPDLPISPAAHPGHW